LYTIVDIETTGNGIKGNKITEIAAFKYDGYEIVSEFTSLVNPECEIPYFITGLTGIDDTMVRDAPKFEEIAQEFQEFTKDCIFVAHSVNFDYNVIKQEYKLLNKDFVRKKLCTVRLSRTLLPGYQSYSLGKLCSSLHIPLKDRHRARGDAHATTLLFQKLLGANGANAVFKRFLNARSQEATLPPSLPKSEYEKLPTRPGVYIFKNEKREIIYIGKAKNVKKRVLSHFYDKATKEVRMCRDTMYIDFEQSGSELLALLMESAAIKKHFPIYNSAQKRTVTPYGIFTYEDRNGILHLAYNKLKLVPNALLTLYNATDCRSFLMQICKAHNLCPKFCHLQENVTHCSHYAITECAGVCRGDEAIPDYNERVMVAVSQILSKSGNQIIKERGRTSNEEALVVLKDDVYLGYGFIPKDSVVNSWEDMEAFLVREKDTLEVQQIIRSYCSRNEANITSFNANESSH